jgi:signal transduction histidine kinase
MLHDFLSANRDRILELTRNKTAGISGSRPTSEELERDLPEFYEHLISVLERESQKGRLVTSPRRHLSTARHARESERLGYTVSQLVHGYGAICQAIMKTAQALRVEITPGEFCTLNLSLDVAIAEAVSEFQRTHTAIQDLERAKQLGFLVHELRNALSSAILAHTLIKQGLVGTGGSTNAMLERAFHRMRDMLDRSFAELRMKSEPTTHRHPMHIIEAVEEVEAAASEDARQKGLTLAVEVDHQLQVDADPQYLVSALANLVQNAIKFSRTGGTVWVRSRKAGPSVVLEVEDQCGGLPQGKVDGLFDPFTQRSADRTGLGLGLAISRQAVELNRGTLSARDLPGRGCVFTISLPALSPS